MITSFFNPKLFESFEDFLFIQDLTGQDMTGLGLDDKLEAAGLPFSVRDPIAVDTFDMVAQMVRAAFYAGYKVGRNPDLLLLNTGAGAQDGAE